MTDEFQICYSKESCLGFVEDDKVLKGKCADGYEGIKCGDCAPGYFRTNDFDCTKCPGDAANFFFLLLGFAGVAIGIILAVAVSLRQNIKSKSKLRVGVLLRMVINHVQMLSIGAALELGWPGSLPVFQVGVGSATLDCLIDFRKNSGDDGIILPLPTIKMIMLFFLPAFMILITQTFWHLRFLAKVKGLGTSSKEDLRLRKPHRVEKDANILTTNCVSLFLIFPFIIKGISDHFLCDTVDGRTFMVKDTTTE